MNSRRKNGTWLIPLLLAAGAAVALGYYWLNIRPQPAEPPPVEPLDEVVEERRPPGPIHPLEPLGPGERGDRDLVPLPSLSDSDAWFRLELVNLFGQRLDDLLASDLVIERVVATIDNLPRSHVAERMRPVGRLSSNLIADATDDGGLVLSSANFDRYTGLVDMLAMADMDEIGDAYRRYYPLLQEAYVSLGYPNGYFNDRVVEVIDHLLETPEITGQIRLARPHVLYEYADPEIEALSSGQKLLIRMGPANAARVKNALAELRARITRE
jgi:hypothetical protein